MAHQHPGWPAALLALLGACSGDWSAYTSDPGALPADNPQISSYPVGPYGTQVGDRITDLSFNTAFFDPEMHCKGAKDLDLTQTEGVRSLSLFDIFRGNPYCPKKKKLFLWIIASAGW